METAYKAATLAALGITLPSPTANIKISEALRMGPRRKLNLLPSFQLGSVKPNSVAGGMSPSLPSSRHCCAWLPQEEALGLH